VGRAGAVDDAQSKAGRLRYALDLSKVPTRADVEEIRTLLNEKYLAALGADSPQASRQGHPARRRHVA